MISTEEKRCPRQQLTVQHREVRSMLCSRLDGRGVWGRMDTCISICMAKSLCCPPETITTLKIDYTLIQNKNVFFLFVCFVFKEKKKQQARKQK